MRLKNITLVNFRNFVRRTFVFDQLLTIIAGQNAVGKTNLLEAIYFVFHGQGFREDKEDELIQRGQTALSVQAEGEEDNLPHQYLVNFNRGPTSLKSYSINKVKKRSFDYVKQTPAAVIFSPGFLYVIDGAAAARRDFIDRILDRIDEQYGRRRRAYEQTLRKRNKLIERAGDPARLREQLPFWDECLIKDGEYIAARRQEWADFLNRHPKLDQKTFAVKYLKNEISSARLRETFDKQFLLKKTLVGPQRDIFEFYLEDVNVHRFGSRSQQRLTLFWLAIGQIRLWEERLGQRPLILLDDVFSELDLVNKSLILKLIKNHQTVIATIEEDFADRIDLPKTVIHL